MIVKVYHIKREVQDKDFVRDYILRPTANRAEILWLTDNMELIAEVTHDGADPQVVLEKAFHLTNTINHPWWENDKVRCIKQSYSTSVGDIMEIDNQLYMVARFGFNEVYPL